MPKLYVGTYTIGSDSKGIYFFEIDADTGSIDFIGTNSDCKNPSFIDIKADRLYAVSELSEKGMISSFIINPDNGKLSLLNGADLPGSAMCHLTLNIEGNFVFAANYSSGNIVACSVSENGEVGKLCSNIQHQGNSVNIMRQEKQHAHSVTFDPAGRFLFAADLGMDCVMNYIPDTVTGELIPNSLQPFIKVAPGEGPRHFTFHPQKQYAYLVTELKNHVVVYDYDPQNGVLTEKCMYSTLPETYTGENLAADIHVSPDGKFLYASNRGYDCIAVFRIDQNNGLLQTSGFYSSHGRWPRNFCIDPKGKFIIIANQESGNLVVCRRDPDTGAICEKLSEVSIPKAVCVRWFE